MKRSPALAQALLAAATAIASVRDGRTPDAFLTALEPAMRPAVMDLVFGTLRAAGRGDFLLGRLLARPLAKAHLKTHLHARLHALLLVAAYRLEQRPQDAHTTVDQAVQAAVDAGAGHYKALVNGVLRNFLRRRDELLSAAAADPVAHWQHPSWWIERLQQEVPDAWQAVLAAGNDHPPMTLRVNRRRGTAADVGRELAAAGIAARALDEWAIRVEPPVAVERLPGFAAGRVSVQDWGAQRAAALLDLSSLAPGARVLDACAAPGGKSAHLLESAVAISLLALELDAARARRIDDNLARLGLAAEVRVADARQVETWWDGRPFARILADVPCSASGVVRRHPDIKWLRQPGDVARFTRTQAAIVDALWPVLAPGGKMLYCTCSVFHAENTEQILAFCRRHPDARRLPTGGADPEIQLLPGPEHDGFYYALLQKSPAP